MMKCQSPVTCKAFSQRTLARWLAYLHLWPHYEVEYHYSVARPQRQDDGTVTAETTLHWMRARRCWLQQRGRWKELKADAESVQEARQQPQTEGQAASAAGPSVSSPSRV